MQRAWDDVSHQPITEAVGHSQWWRMRCSDITRWRAICRSILSRKGTSWDEDSKALELEQSLVVSLQGQSVHRAPPSGAPQPDN
jgi:hypothetical protein